MSYISIGVFVIGVMCLVVAVTVTGLPTFRHVFCVPEGHAGLLYRDGLYVRRHNAGCNIVWGLGWTIDLVDLRKTSMPLLVEEVLTADKLGLNFSLVMTYTVDDPVIATHATQHWRSDLQNATQVALRAIVSEVAMERLLTRRTETGAKVLEQVQPGAVRIGIHVIAIEVEDMILPAELRESLAKASHAKRSVQGRRIFSVDGNGEGL